MEPSKILGLIDRSQSCHCWTGKGFDKDGRASVRHNGRTKKVHIAVWEILKGPRTPGMILEHTCNHKWCLNVEHIEETTQHVNLLRHYRERRTHCLSGHVLSPDNIYQHPRRYKAHQKTNTLTCLTCRNLRRAEWRARVAATSAVS